MAKPSVKRRSPPDLPSELDSLREGAGNCVGPDARVPSYVLRLQGSEQDSAFDELVRDLRLAARFVSGG